MLRPRQVNSPQGFAVSLANNSSSYTVSFDAWHDEYQDMEKALNSFAFGLSDDCRLEATCSVIPE
jgi:hypothetical protein